MLRVHAARAVLAIGISILATLTSAGSAQAVQPTAHPVQTKTMAAAQGGDSATLPVSTNGLSDCPSNRICFWANANYQGTFWHTSLPDNTVYCYQPNGFDINLGLPPESVYNNTGGTIILYLVPTCSIFTVQDSLGPGESRPGGDGYFAWYYKRS